MASRETAGEEALTPVAQMIAAVCAALSDADRFSEEMRLPAEADQAELAARLRRSRTRLDRIEAQIAELKTELALHKRALRA